MSAAAKRTGAGGAGLVLAGLRKSFNAVRLGGLLATGGAVRVALAVRSVARAAGRLMATTAGLMLASAALIGRGVARLASVVGSTAQGAIRLAASGVSWVVGLAAATGHATKGTVSSAAFALSRARGTMGSGLHALLTSGRRLLGNRRI